MTYLELKTFLGTLTPEQLEMKAEVYVGEVDVFFPIIGTEITEGDDTGDYPYSLDDQQPYLRINF